MSGPRRCVAQETHLVIATSDVMGLRFVGKSTRKSCGTPEIATPTAPSEYTLSLKNMVKGRPVMNGVDEHIIPIYIPSKPVGREVSERYTLSDCGSCLREFTSPSGASSEKYTRELASD